MDTLNVLFGPPIQKERTVLSFFFSLPGKHVVCGGTTANLVSAYLNKPLDVELTYVLKEVPPIGKIEGCDLVTEGIITMRRVEKLLAGTESPDSDGASLIYNAMHGAEKINFVCGDLSEEKKILLKKIIFHLKQEKKTVETFLSLCEG